MEILCELQVLRSPQEVKEASTPHIHLGCTYSCFLRGLCSSPVSSARDNSVLPVTFCKVWSPQPWCGLSSPPGSWWARSRGLHGPIQGATQTTSQGRGQTANT